MKIRLLAVTGCSRCESLITKLNLDGVLYETAYCEKEPSSCDCVESIIQTNYYPIIILEKNKEMLEIVYLANSYETLSEGKKEISGIITVPNHSIENMLFYVKNRLNL